MFGRGGVKRKKSFKHAGGVRKALRKDLEKEREFTAEERRTQCRAPSAAEWLAELEEENRALRKARDKCNAHSAKKDRVIRQLRRLVKHQSITLWDKGCAHPRSEFARLACLREAMKKAAAKLGVKLESRAVQKSVAMWVENIAKEERLEKADDGRRPGEEASQDQYDELLMQDQLMALRKVMDQYAVSDNVVKQLFMVLKLKGVSGDATAVAKHALNDVMEDTFHIHTNDDVTWIEPKELVLLAMRLAGVGSGAGDIHPDFVVVGDGRTAGNKTTTFLALRLVRVGADHQPTPGYKNIIFPLALLDSGEKYDVLEPVLSDLLDMLAKTQEVGFDMDGGGKCTPVWWLGGDMKWLLMVTGCSTAPNACMHCHCSRDQRAAYMTVWPLERTDTDTKEQGRLRENLFWFVPVSRIMPDFLHLHLRIGERLIHATCESLLTQAQVVQTDGDPEFKNGAKWLAEQLGPQIILLAKVADVNFELRDQMWSVTPKLTGNRLRPVLAGLKMAEVPFFAKGREEKGLVTIATRLQAAWDDFVTLFEAVNQPEPFDDDLGVDEWQRKVQGWVMACVHSDKKTKALFPASFVTPYVHTFMNHVPSLLLLWGDLHEFAGQEFERENNVHNLIWFRCSSRKGLSATRGIVLAALRRIANTEGDDRVYICLQPGCGKRYKGAVTLGNHTRSKHSTLPQPSPAAHAKATNMLLARATIAKAFGDEMRALAYVHSAKRRDLKNEGKRRLRAEDKAARALLNAHDQ